MFKIFDEDVNQAVSRSNELKDEHSVRDLQEIKQSFSANHESMVSFTEDLFSSGISKLDQEITAAQLRCSEKNAEVGVADRKNEHNNFVTPDSRLLSLMSKIYIIVYNRKYYNMVSIT